MQLQFHKSAVSCLHKIKSEVQYQELTHELRLPDGMPDVGKVLGAWGQVLIRGKEWRSGRMNVNGGVMVWAMYMPEDETQPQMVEGWLPFQMNWELPETQYDGTILVNPLLRSVDARSTSARKLMLRTSVGVLAEALVPTEFEVYEPESVPEEVQLLTQTYPMLLQREAGEKAFALEEELVLPGSAPPMAKLLRFSLQPELIEQKVMSGKVVFRGIGIVHIMYMGTDELLHSWDFDIPFSQYTDLGCEYEADAQSVIRFAQTALEMDTDPEGRLQLKAGLTGQYVICDRSMISVVEDAYGIKQKVTPNIQMLSMPVILDSQKQTVHVQAQMGDSQVSPADISVYPDQMHIHRNGNGYEGEIAGYFQMLGYDSIGRLSGDVFRWNQQMDISAGENSEVAVFLQPSAVPQVSGGNSLSADVLLQMQTISSQGIPMVTGLQIEEQQEESERPSLILRRTGNESLWELAKNTGSTVDAIRRANKLETDPVPGKILIIPVG